MHRRISVSDEARDFVRDRVELSVRASNVVQALDVKTMGEFMGLTRKAVLSTHNAGAKTWAEIAQVQHNLSPGGALSDSVSCAADLVRMLNDEMNSITAFSDAYYLTLDATGDVALIKRIS